MYKKFIPIISLLIIIGLTPHISGGEGPLIPPPVFTNAGIQSSVTYDSATGLYTYSYTISNPATNTGEIWRIDIDISYQPSINTVNLSSYGLIIPRGNKIRTFDELAARRDKPMVPVGIRVPSSTEWGGSLTNNGTAGFSTGAGSGPGGLHINPGETKGGFELITRGWPTIRNVEIEPWWLYVSEGSISKEEEDLADQIEDSLIFHTKSLGPSVIWPGTFEHWDQLRDDLNQAIQLGWIMDTTLANALVTQLASARQAVDASDGTLAKNILQTILNTLSQTTSSQISSDAKGLISLNVQKLIEYTSDTPIPFEPKTIISPQSSTLPLGTLYTLTVTMVNSAYNNNPIPGWDILLEAIEGPNWEEFSLPKKVYRGLTDSEGKIQFSYRGTKLGTDKFRVVQGGEAFIELGFAEVTWAGGPDLGIELFVPPYVKGQGGDIITTIEITGNYGNTSVSSSLTRYFLSDDDIIDPNQDSPIGEHAISPLEPGKISDKYTQAIQLPSDLPQGKYYLGACADADQTVAELNEENNCEVNQLVVVFEGAANQPPDCTKAAATPHSLWPPNHKLVIISIGGVTDPDGDPLTLTILRITQDEPVNGLGDGDTSPDGFIGNDGAIMLRSERSGKGNGRVYAVTFNAEDGRGGNCTGTIKVGIPHDQGKGSTPIDDGQNYDSTLL